MKYPLLKKIISFLFLFFIFLAPLFFVSAQGTGSNTGSSGTGSNTGGVGIENPLKKINGKPISSVYDLVNFIVNDIIIPFGSVIMVLMIIFAGFQFVVAQGNPKKIEDAKETLKYAIIGSAILLGSWAIAEIIQNTVGAITG